MVDRSGGDEAIGAAEVAPRSAHTGSGSADVFISYASPDRGVADAVCGALEGGGLICWVAPRDVVPGEFYADSIVRAIDATKVIVLVLSKNSADSPHVLREVERGSSKRHPVVSLRIDLAPLPSALEYFLNTSHWLDASASGVDSALPKVVAAVRHLASPVLMEPAHPIGTAKSEEKLASHPGMAAPASRRTSRSLIAIIALVGVALAYFVADKFWLSKRVTIGSAQPSASSMTSGASAAATNAGGGTAAFAPPAHSIAVLPFVNMSGDPKQDYFSDGLSEELLNSLVSLRGLQVAARTSSFSFKGSGTDVAEIARKLNVGAVLEGSVRKDGGRVRITAQLINAVTGFHLWSQTYDRDLKNVLVLQTEIATAVTKALQATLLADASTVVELGGTHDPHAFDAYLRGRGIEVISKETNLAQIAAFDEAIRLDPMYAKAYASKGMSLGRYAGSYESASNARHVMEEAHALSEKAVQLAPNLAEAHLDLAESYDRGLLDFAHGMAEYERALTLGPGDARVLGSYAIFLARMGHADAAAASAQRAVTLDPVNAGSYHSLGYVFLFSHRNREAIAAFDRALSLDPQLHWAHGLRGLAYLGLGEFETARQSCSTPPPSWVDQLCLAVAYDKLGRKAEAQAEVSQMKAVQGDAMAYQFASIYAQWGDMPTALDWLEVAYRLKDPGLAWLKIDFLLDPLRHEPRFEEIERKLHFPS
jgi:TolB-like protein/tetratricopeptide (TPR) repeat protein